MPLPESNNPVEWLPNAISNSHFFFVSGYYLPDFASPLLDILTLLQSWPIFTEGADVGLSKNMPTVTVRNGADRIFNSFIEIQPTLVSPKSESRLSAPQFGFLSSIQSFRLRSGYKGSLTKDPPISSYSTLQRISRAKKLHRSILLRCKLSHLHHIQICMNSRRFL
jgi:hypothetical protein